MYISVDIGGTNIRIAATSSLEIPRFEPAPIRAKSTRNYERDLSFIIDGARRLAGSKPIRAVGIGMPGSFNDQKTELVSTRYTKHWVGHPFVATLSNELNCPVFIENDGVAAGLGEAYYGNHPKQFCYVVWGTGIGGASIVTNADKTQVEVAKFDHKTHFKAWEDDCGGHELEEHYHKTPADLSAEQWQKVMGKFETHLHMFIELTGTRAVVFGGGIAIRKRQELEAMATAQTSVTASNFNEDSGVYGGLGVIRANVHL